MKMIKDKRGVLKRLKYINNKKRDAKKLTFLFFWNAKDYSDEDAYWLYAFGRNCKDEMPGTLFDLSLMKTIVRIVFRKHYDCSQSIDVLLSESKDHSTNIDADVIEKLMGMLI